MAQITVMGAGIFGLTAAYELARRGASVRVLERDQIGAGASGGILGALAPHVPENWNAKKAFQLESLLASEGFWRDVQQLGGVDPGYARLGRVQPIDDAAALERARERALSSRSLWPDHVAWNVLAAAQAPGPMLSSGSGHVIYDTLTARIAPRQAVKALAAALKALDVQIETGHVAPTKGSVLWANGAQGLADLSAAFEQPVGNAVKGQGALLGLDWRDAPQLFVDGLHIVPHGDGTVAVGSTSEREFDDATSTDAQLDALIAKARAVSPELNAAPVVTRWAGLRPRARTRAPILGAWPRRDGHFVLNGGFKIGFGMAVGLACVIADLMLDGHDRVPIGFRVEDNLRG